MYNHIIKLSELHDGLRIILLSIMVTQGFIFFNRLIINTDRCLVDAFKMHIRIIIYLNIRTFGTIKTCKSRQVQCPQNTKSMPHLAALFLIRRGWRPRSSWKLRSGQIGTSRQESRWKNTAKYQRGDFANRFKNQKNKNKTSYINFS